MTAKPVPIDLTPFAEMVDDSREFVRLWARSDGAVVCFVNPVPIGADPAGFGIAMVDCVRHAAEAYARALNIPPEDALTRIWEGFDAERTHPSEPSPPPPVLEI